jgi:hypothetical protein
MKKEREKPQQVEVTQARHSRYVSQFESKRFRETIARES